MRPAELREELEARVNGACQCVDATHEGAPCPNTAVARFVGPSTISDLYFSYTCAACRAAAHKPYLVYDREGGSFFGLADGVGADARNAPDEWRE